MFLEIDNKVIYLFIVPTLKERDCIFYIGRASHFGICEWRSINGRPWPGFIIQKVQIIRNLLNYASYFVV